MLTPNEKGIISISWAICAAFLFAVCVPLQCKFNVFWIAGYFPLLAYLLVTIGRFLKG